MTNRMIFEIEVKNKELSYFLNKEANLNDENIMFLFGSMMHTLISNRDEKSIMELIQAVIKILKDDRVLLSYNSNYSYSYTENKVSGFTESLPISIAQIANILHKHTRLYEEVCLLSFFQRSLELYGYLVERNRAGTNLFFLNR